MVRMKTLLGSLIFLALVGLSASAQSQQGNSERMARENSVSARLGEASDLAKENLEHVAASAAQIQAVLRRDPGILVELKREVAKEATDNGQIVVDSQLTDQAIFDRLESDVKFRSQATLLVQRYGYLLPSANPDSEFAKQQDLMLKERARRLVQIEAQEDSESLRPRGGDGNEGRAERTAACDLQRDPNCGEAASPRTRLRNNIPGESPAPAPPLPGLLEQQLPSFGPMRTLRTSLEGGELEQLGSRGTESGPAMRADARESVQTALARRGQTGLPDDLASATRSVGLQNFPALLDSNSLAEALIPDREALAKMPQAVHHPPSEKDLAPVTMVHKPNPYADIPSLYDMYVQASSRDGVLEHFGLALFRNGSLAPEAVPMDMPVGPDYVVGPGDSLSINLWGGIAQRISRVVDREGRIVLPEAGPLLVSGHTLDDVQRSVQHVMRTVYRDISADVSLSRLRTVRVYVVGEVMEPGAYDISSLSTPLNALFAAGGVTSNGSLRAVKHYRGTQLVEEVDTYDLLLHGVRGDMLRLQDGDSLIVPAMGPQVTVSGMVRRPAMYELHGESSLLNVLDLAGGILPAAALRHIEVQRLEAHEKRTMLSLDVAPESDPEGIAKQLSAFKIQDGDQIHIFPITPYNKSAVYLEGHVLRPGRYSFKEGMRLTDLVASYGDLMPEPAGHYAEIVRLNAPDSRPSVESFDLSSALNDPATAPVLRPLDTVRIFSKYDFEEAPSVWIGGAVRAPGMYRTSGQTHVRDAIYLAGGVSPDAALDATQLFRSQSDGTLKIFSVNLGAALGGNPADNLVLEPRDRILVQRNPAKVDPPSVCVKGEVAKPGCYPLTTNLRVEGLIQVAGGLKRSADPGTADLTRYPQSGARKTMGENLTIELDAALGGRPEANVRLEDGDVLTIRQSPGWDDIGATASVRGEVLHPGPYGIRPDERLSSLLLRAGGFSAESYPYGAVLMRPAVRDMEMQSQLELVQRLKAEQATLQGLPESDSNQKNAKLTALAQAETTLEQLQAHPPVGRLVIHIGPKIENWQNTAVDPPLRDGDIIMIPKKANYVTVTGQVFNATAISYRPGKSGTWYLREAGGLTTLADKQAAFVIRADGSVIASKNNSRWFSGDPLSAVLRPGDSVVVPEKAPKVGGRNWAALMQAAQVASSVALTAAYVKP
jgi:protein involved in polysaccharide export with SLBB domain